MEFQEVWNVHGDLTTKLSALLNISGFKRNVYCKRYVDIRLGNRSGAVTTRVYFPDHVSPNARVSIISLKDGQFSSGDDKTIFKHLVSKQARSFNFDGKLHISMQLNRGVWEISLSDSKICEIVAVNASNQVHFCVGEIQSKLFTEYLRLVDKYQHSYKVLDVSISVFIDDVSRNATKCKLTTGQAISFDDAKGCLEDNFDLMALVLNLNDGFVGPRYTTSEIDTSRALHPSSDGLIRLYDCFDLPDENDVCGLVIKNMAMLNTSVDLIIQFWIGDGDKKVEFVTRWGMGNTVNVEFWFNDDKEHAQSKDFVKYPTGNESFVIGRKFLLGYHKDEWRNRWYYNLNGVDIGYEPGRLVSKTRSFGTELQFKATKEPARTLGDIHHLNMNVYYLKVLPQDIQATLRQSRSAHVSRVINNLKPAGTMNLNDVSDVKDFFNKPNSPPKRGVESEPNTASKKQKVLDSKLSGMFEKLRPFGKSKSMNDRQPSVAGDINNSTQSEKTPEMSELKLVKVDQPKSLNVESCIDPILMHQINVSVNEVKNLLGVDYEMTTKILFQIAILKGTSQEMVNDKSSLFRFEEVPAKLVKPRDLSLIFFKNNPKINLLRTFCRLNSQQILEMLRIGVLAPNRKFALDCGLPTRYSYLAGDFWDFNLLNLTEEEEGVIRSVIRKPISNSKSLIHYNQLLN
uniref:CPm n=1 Tax=Malus domestica virus A TaxID=2664236 RepID=A0A6M3RHP5_9CLOS|nr:CPm [Malus domestica virus A]